MGGRSKSREEGAKGRRRKTAAPKRRIGSKTQRRSSSNSGSNSKVARLTRELNEALERQRATAELLGAISRSNFELQSILQSVVDTASQLCRAERSVIFRLDAGVYRYAAGYGIGPAYIEYERRTPISPGLGTLVGRAAMSRQVVQIEDALTDPFYEQKAAIKKGGGRSMLGVPLMREGEPIGVLGLSRTRVEPFTQREVDLVTTFADQAVIAIENTRLFEAARQRTRELSESLEQQTATSEVLQAISSSPGDLGPVFAAMLEKAVRVCDAKYGSVFRCEGDTFRFMAMHNVPPALAKRTRHAPFRPTAKHYFGRMITTKAVVHVADAMAEEGYIERRPEYVAAVELSGVRTYLMVPMLKEAELIGAFIVGRQEVRPFTEKQIDLVKNFAAQAVIAIENARLLSELRESLEQQIATSEILGSMSDSMTDSRPVFDTIVRNLLRLFGTRFATVQLLKDRTIHLAALNGEPGFERLADRFPVPLDDSTLAGRTMLSKRVVRLAPVIGNVAAPAATDRNARDFGYNSMIFAPMLRAGEVIGAIGTAHRDAKAFDNKQAALIAAFADQAVIAIENTRLFEAEQLRARELTESLQQQTATADVLKVISRSTFDLRTVLETLVESAARLCEADMATIWRPDGPVYRIAATYQTTTAHREYLANLPIKPGRGSCVGRTLLDAKVVQIPDIREDAEYTLELKEEGARSGYRTMLGVPLVREGKPIGVIALVRSEVRSFTAGQIELVTTFADQAVIAIENARLFEAEQQRTRELSESLEQQTATSDVLRIISRSTGDLTPVFEAMLRNAVRICGAQFGNLLLRDADTFRFGATHGAPPAYVDFVRREGPFRIDSRLGLGRMLQTKQTYQVADIAAAPTHRDKLRIATIELAGARTVLGVPMLKDNDIVGSIIIYRREVRPFTDKQIELVQNFAAQAVIAIENTRLINELRQRTTDLTESLEQQTATANVLRVIAGSPTDIEPVLEVIVRTAGELCESEYAILWRLRDGKYYMAWSNNADPEWVKYWAEHPITPNRGTLLGRTVLECRAVHILDCLNDPEYTQHEAARLGRQRSMLGVPLLRDGAPIGGICLLRTVVKPFTERQIELVTAFADQAVIAIENTRLLTELRQRTDDLGRSVEELRALGEVSQAVNSTLDLETVLSTIVAKAVQLSGTEAGAIYVFDDKQPEFHLRATYGMDRELIDALARQHIGFDEPNVALAFAEREPIQVADLKEQPSSPVNEIILRAGFRALLGAPLLRGEEIVGLLVVRRRTPGAFLQNTIDLIKTFAAQSAVAIENARLFQDIETSLEDLRTAQDRLVQTQKLASLGQLTAGIAHEIKNPLNFVNNFSSVSAELLDELQDVVGRMKGDVKTHEEIIELTNTLRDNLHKIVQHGKRADSIVKNMLLHSREGSGEHRPVDINALVEESLNLAYHGARAEKQGFNITLERSFDPAAGNVEVFPQEITRVLLNLISNGFYAATKRKGQAVSDGYEPTLTVATKNLGDRVEIRIRDNGAGIPPEVKEKMFNPFFTTKPAGEGTGLGLSLSHDIVVKQHAGSMEVDTQPGEFTEFRVVLSRKAASQAKRGGQA